MEVLSGQKNSFEKEYKLPVVVVPGIMGTRLKIYLAEKVALWEPDSKKSVAKNFARKNAQQKRKILDPANKIEYPEDLPKLGPGQMLRLAPPEFSVPSPQEMGLGGATGADLQKSRKFKKKVRDHLVQKGWNEVSWDYYGGLLLYLQTHSFQGADCPVYAVGYDWRKSNSESAERLDKRIRDITEEENADQVVIVTHSMGGLVARSYVNQYGEDAVQGVIHITQPTYGAPLLYRRFRVGALTKKQQALLGSYGGLLGGWDKLIWSVKVEGEQTDPESAATIAGIMDGALELLPTASYRMKRAEQVPYSSWLSWPEWWVDGEQPPQDVSSLYQQSTDRLGIIPPGFEFREDLEERIRAATKFQDDIDEVFHSNTYWICSSEVNTDVAVRVEQLQTRDVMSANRYGTGIEGREIVPHEGPGEPHLTDQGLRVIRYVSEKGDGTVPLDSQLGFEMKPGVHEPEEEKIKRMQGVEHSDICTYESVQWRVTEWIQEMISNYAQQCLPERPL